MLVRDRHWALPPRLCRIVQVIDDDDDRIIIIFAPLSPCRTLILIDIDAAAPFLLLGVLLAASKHPIKRIVYFIEPLHCSIWRIVLLQLHGLWS